MTFDFSLSLWLTSKFCFLLSNSFFIIFSSSESYLSKSSSSLGKFSTSLSCIESSFSFCCLSWSLVSNYYVWIHSFILSSMTLSLTMSIESLFSRLVFIKYILIRGKIWIYIQYLYESLISNIIDNILRFNLNSLIVRQLTHQQLSEYLYLFHIALLDHYLIISTEPNYTRNSNKIVVKEKLKLSS